MEKRIIIEDGTSKAQLTEAIKNFETRTNTTVIKMFVSENHIYRMVEFNGICITKWGGLVDDFINEVNIGKMYLIDLF